MDADRAAAAETSTTQPSIRRPETDPGPGRVDGDSVRAAQRGAVEHAAARDGLRLRDDLLASVGALATGGRLERLHAVLLAELHRREEVDLARAVVDSSSLRALRGGKKLDRTLPIAARPGRSIMFSPTRTGFRSSRR